MFDEAALKPVLSTIGLSVTATDGRTILRGVNLDIPRRLVTGIIGPSGAGKSTLLKTLNRLIDLTPSLRVSGRVVFDGEDVRARGVDPDELRRRVGTVFQQPVMFPGSIEANVLFAAKRLGIATRSNRAEVLEGALRQSGLWEEVKDRLGQPASTLSIGQQQRLAIARTLAGRPDVILMDEPTSALDPRSTEVIEQSVRALIATKTVVLVTHDLEQTRRICDYVACLCTRDGAGELMEAAACESVFCAPRTSEARAYLGVRC